MSRLTRTVALNDREQSTWTRVAPGWRKHDARLLESTSPVTERMLARLRLSPGRHVLDIASGTGEPAIPAARSVGPTGRVVGTDFVPEMLAIAREKAARAGLRHLEFIVSDGEALTLPSDSFDAVSMRFGLMFMADPVECLRRAHDALKPDGRIAVACWAGADLNPWAAIPMGIVRRHLKLDPPPPGAPGLFAMADQDRLRSTIESAGFRNVRVEPVDVTMADFASGQEYFDFTLELAGPIAMLFERLPADAKAAVAAEIMRAATGPDGRAHLTGVSWVASGEKQLTTNN